MNTLQKIIMQDNLPVGVAYIIGVFLFVGVIFGFVKNAGYIKNQLCISLESNRQDVRTYALSMCSIVMLAGSLVAVNAYPYVLPAPICSPIHIPSATLGHTQS
jgi:hypothetical protein